MKKEQKSGLKNHFNNPDEVIITLITIVAYATIIIAMLVSTSCMSYNRAVKKYGHVVTDTITVEKLVTITVPKDSAIITLRTDTTHVVKELQQGRATVRIIRDNYRTLVQATCDSATIAKNVLAKVPRQSVYWGVSKWYKRGFWLLFTALAVLIIAYFISKTFTFSVQKKSPHWRGEGKGVGL